MDATLKNLHARLENPGPGFEQVINGRTPYDRLKRAAEEGRAHWRKKQIDYYTRFCESAQETVDDAQEVLGEVSTAVQRLKKDLRRGVVKPDEVMRMVAQSIRGLNEITQTAQQVREDAQAAREMVDLDPADYEQQVRERFPSMPTPILTEEYLRGEEDGPFSQDGA